MSEICGVVSITSEPDPTVCGLSQILPAYYLLFEKQTQVCSLTSKSGNKDFNRDKNMTKVRMKLTPCASTCYRGLDINSHGRKGSNGDGEDEAHGQSHNPDLMTQNSIIPRSV